MWNPLDMNGERPRPRNTDENTETHVFETTTNWMDEDRTAADNRIKREMDKWRKDLIDRVHGGSEK